MELVITLFLNTIRMIESTNCQNINHKVITSGIHKNMMNKVKLLKAISFVESSNNTYINHSKIENGPYKNFIAYGQYGLLQPTINYTIKNTKRLHKYKELLKYNQSSLFEYMKKHKNFENEIAGSFYDILAKKLEYKDIYIIYAWLNGLTGSLRMLKSKKDVRHHWYVERVINAYGI